MTRRSMADHPESEPYRFADSASHLLHRAEQLSSDRFAQLAGEGGLTLRQFAVLAALSETPGLSQSELVRATSIDRSTLADIVARLVKRELIIRTPSPTDARAYSVRMTNEGEAAFAASVTHARAADAAILDLLPRTKGRTLLGTLTKLSKLADKAAEKAEREARRQAKRDAKKRDKAQGKSEKGKRRKPKPQKR
jgi:MarR family transcriptional regulator, temperature-dependent positive regulator of motility